jgi:hypothetical protein
MQWRKVSAVMIYTNLVIADARDQEPWIVHNPWATTPLPFDLLPLSQLVPDRTRNTLSKKEGSIALYIWICRFHGHPMMVSPLTACRDVQI